MAYKRISFNNTPIPPTADINSELQWIGSTLGLFNERDRDSSCFRVFITLVQATKKQQKLSSDEIAELTALSRGTVCYHLNNLKNAGLIDSENGYSIKKQSLSLAIKELEEDIQETLKIILAIAKDIEKKLP